MKVTDVAGCTDLVPVITPSIEYQEFQKGRMKKSFPRHVAADTAHGLIVLAVGLIAGNVKAAGFHTGMSKALPVFV